jgi:DNA polymerase III sliding clamp (beta) subunit (PCNA family)
VKIEADQDLFRGALRRCLLGGGTSNIMGFVRGVAKKSMLPGERDEVRFTATNGLLGVDTAIACTLDQSGEFVVSCKAVEAATRAMPPGALRAEVKGGRLTIRSASGRTWSTALISQEMPSIGEPKDAAWLEIPTARLRRILERVRFGTSNTMQSYRHLDGVRIDAPGDGELVGVVCGEHLCLADEAKEPALRQKGPWAALIPSMMLPSIDDLIKEADDAKKTELSLYITKDHLFATGPSTMVVSVLPLGDYLPWRQVFSGETHVSSVPRLALIEILHALGSSVSESSASASVTVKKDVIEVRGRGENDDFFDSVPLTGSGPDADVSFVVNASLFHGVLKSADENPELEMPGSGRGIILHTPSGFRAYLALIDARDQ